jgi:DNA-directed RNA polymerase specialized sigma24 family protein
MTAGGSITAGDETWFEGLVERVEPSLRRALVAAYGAEVGREAAAEALAWAWEHLDRVDRMPNPGGYLFRVGQTAARKGRRWSGRRADAPVPEVGRDDEPAIEPRLAAALDGLSPHQRAAVLLVHGWGESLVDAAAALGCGVPTLRNHLARGLAKLRAHLGEATDA